MCMGTTVTYALPSKVSISSSFGTRSRSEAGSTSQLAKSRLRQPWKRTQGSFMFDGLALERSALTRRSRSRMVIEPPRVSWFQRVYFGQVMGKSKLFEEASSPYAVARPRARSGRRAARELELGEPLLVRH